MLLDDNIQDPAQTANPSDTSSHDERDEKLAVEETWDQDSNDPAAIAGQRLAEFAKDNVPLSDKDWEKEEAADDVIPDHIEAAVDVSLEEMIDNELIREDGEAVS